jgi:hypothetical protein
VTVTATATATALLIVGIMSALARQRWTVSQRALDGAPVNGYSGAGEGRLPIHSSAKSCRPGPLIHPPTVRDWLRVVACTIECSAVITAYTCPPPSLCSLAWSPPCRTQHGHPNTAAGCGAPENVPLQEREACTGATAPLAPDALAACSAEPAAHACCPRYARPE